MSRGFLLGSTMVTLATMPKPVDSQCRTFQTAIQVLGRPWNALILNVLQEGPLRFSALSERAKGAGDKVLSSRLNELEAQGPLVRQVDAGPAVRRSAEATRAGRVFGELAPARARRG